MNLFPECCEERLRRSLGAFERRLAFLRFVKLDDEPFSAAFFRRADYAVKVKHEIVGIDAVEYVIIEKE